MFDGWNEHEVEVAKDLFRTDLQSDESTVRRGPTEMLWRFWDASGLERSLFGDPEEDLALLLYARAYGLSTPWDDDPGLCGELLRAHRDGYADLVPASLPLGVRANLSPSLGAVLESPILDVWVYRDGKTPLRVLIFGAGLPGIREQVLGDAFMTSLRLGTPESHFVGVGAVQVEVGAAQRPVAPPINVLGAAGALQPPAATAQEALDGFVSRLKKLADRSGLLRLRDADDAAYRQLCNEVAQRANPNPDDRPRLWAPGHREPGGAALAVLVPCFRFAVPQRRIPGARPLELQLSRDLLAGAAYQSLARSYRGNTLDRLLDDARRRHAFHVGEARRLRRDHQAYEATPEDDRATMWGATVTLSHWFDFDTHRAIPLAFPEEVSAETFYLEHVPRQADRHEEAANEMLQVVNDVGAAEASQEAPIPRLTAGCLLDAALRGRRPPGSAAFATAFDEWAGRVRPMLCFEWRRLLRSQGIEPADVFTPHTVVQTYFSANQETLVQSPYTVVDRRHSAILIDHARGVVVVCDPTDRVGDDVGAAVTVGVDGDEEGKGQQRWGELVKAADRPDMTAEAFEELLLAALRDAPEHVIGKVMEALSGVRADEDRAKAASELAKLESSLAAVTREFGVPYGMRRAWTALGVGAAHTTRTQLTAVSDTPGKLGAQVALMEAVAEFLWSGRPTTSAHDCFSVPEAAGLPDRFEQAVVRARERDPDYTAQWIGLLQPERQLDFTRVAHRLLLGLPDPNEQGDPQQRAALLSQTGAEAARLARDLEQAAELLADDGEPVATTWAKLGQALEGLFLAEFAGGGRDDAVTLLKILTARGR